MKNFSVFVMSPFILILCKLASPTKNMIYVLSDMYQVFIH